MTPQTHKTCTTCGTEKPKSQFYRDSSKTDGLRGPCKPCTYTKTKAKAADGLVKCSACKERKAKEQFYSASRRCIPCDNSRTRQRTTRSTSDFQRIAKCLEATLQLATNRKICTSCEIEQDLQDFRRRPKNIDGRSKVCKRCLRRRGKETPTTTEQKVLDGLSRREQIFLQLIEKKKKEEKN